MVRRVSGILVFCLMLFSCLTGERAAEEAPSARARLSLAGIEAEGPRRAALIFTLELDNPGGSPLQAVIGAWRAELDGQPVQGVLIPGAEMTAAPASSAAFPLRLELELPAGEEAARVPELHRARLELDLSYTGGAVSSGRSRTGTVSAEALFPAVREPEFTITSIAVMKAELINTRLRVSLRIDNPNGFPLALSALDYELYGAGRFWAGGTWKDELAIPPRSSVEVQLALVMNFINMRRDMLDQIIARREVPYRFTGAADLVTGLEHLPFFRAPFDRTGLSEVVE